MKYTSVELFNSEMKICSNIRIMPLGLQVYHMSAMDSQVSLWDPGRLKERIGLSEPGGVCVCV